MASKPNPPRIGVRPAASAVVRVSAPPAAAPPRRAPPEAPPGHDATRTAPLGYDDATRTAPPGRDDSDTALLGHDDSDTARVGHDESDTARLGHDDSHTARRGHDAALTVPNRREAAPPANLELRAGATIKHYEILRPLGRGGMGAVFLARDTKLGRLVAVKVLREQSPQGARRLLAEARATARCRHENIVVIHEVDEVGGRPYLVLEYLEGSTLRAWLAARGRPGASAPAAGGEDAGERVAPGRAIELMIPVVRALACAHALGIVHRDLKPENIVLTDAGPIKVLDFGIAKVLGADELSALAAPGEPGAELTGPGELLGTLTYMAPEQWRHATIDPRTDLWAVGVLLYRLVAGVHPLGPTPSLFDLAQLASPEPPVPSVLTRCPELGPLAALIDRCLRKAPAERFASAAELLAALEALGPARAGGRGAEGESPFVGLAALQEADAPHFFGREWEVSGALGRWQRQPLLTIAGPSGAGKSSFVRAGLIPALRRAVEPTEAFVVRPGRRPLAALADVLVRAAAGAPGAGDAERLVATLRAQPGLLGTRLRERCRRLGERGRLVLFVDQFEELYSLGAPADERAAFVACLQGAADDASSPLRVLLSLRSDFLDRTAEDGPFATEVTRGLLLLRPMGREGLAEALTRPLEAVGYRFEDEALVRSMLDELTRARSPLPLLQFTAALLWQARDRDRRLLTRASYEGLGGVAGALSAHADATLAALSPPERGLCREIFLRLVTPERTRAVVGLDELRALGPGGDAVASVVGRLADARLVLVEPSGGAEGPTVELVHEALLDRWATLKRWLDESAQDAHFLARLRAAAHAWQAGGEAEGLLWRERAADDARAWLERRRAERGHGATADRPEVEARYLRAVVALSGRARRRRRAAVASVIAALGAIALLVSMLAVGSRRDARRSAEEAARTRAEADRADAAAAFARNAVRLAAAHELQANDPTTALAFLREVEPPGVPDDWAEQALLALHGGVSSTVIAHQSVVLDAAFSPDGRRIATACGDNTVRVWNADGRGEPLVLRGHEAWVITVRFSADGRRLVSSSRDGTARVWNADGSGEPVVLRGHGDQGAGAEFSADGARVVTASWDGTARVWNADGRGEPLVLRGHAGRVYSAAFSPDGTRVVTASQDRTARVWNADGSGKPLVLRGHSEPIRTAAFSPDGTRVVTASHDRTARVWNVEGDRASAQRPAVYRHEAILWSAAFSPDGRRIVTAAGDATARVWNIDGRAEPLALRGHGDLVRSASFSPDGRRVVTSSFDQTARVWDADGASQPLVLRNRVEAFSAVTFSPDGRHVAASSLDKTVRVWNADGRGEPLVLRGHDDWIFNVNFGPDGRRLVSGSQDRTARVWNADGSGKPLVLRGHEGTVIWATFSPDGRRIATASFDRTARVWNADGTGEPLVLRGHADALTAVAFSPDGARLATTSQDKTVRVWNADGRGEPLVLRGHDDWVESIVFSPDGRRLLTASDDKTARVWNADGSGEPLVLRGHRDKLGAAAFSPDGERIATASRDGTLRIWRADGSGEPLVLRGHDKEVNSIAFSPDGRRIATASEDKTLRLWPDLTPIRGYDDPTLWAATSYCPSVERRVELLHVPEAAARAEHEACERRTRAPAPPAKNPREP